MSTFTQYAQNACMNTRRANVEDVQNASCIGPLVALIVFVSFSGRKNRYRLIMYSFTFLNFVIAVTHLANGCQSV